ACFCLKIHLVCTYILGTSHYYQYENAIQGDDEILIDVEIQLADYYLLENEQELEFNVSFDYSKDRQTTITQLIKAIVTSVETPDLVYTLNIPEYDPMELNPGDLLLVNSTIEHSTLSSAHAYGLIVNLMVPFYIKIDDSVEIEGTSMIETDMSTSDGVQFQVRSVF
ncbi:uncharacterized protein LOC117111600, partial [Anneissia japonica]|uniref:uncharacterized protein LOC117111600 n=1 Tax=Anneissia japonica TaxID=1529436 RepID=UPI0014255431